MHRTGAAGKRPGVRCGGSAADSDWEEVTGYQPGPRQQWRPSSAPCHGSEQVFNVDWGEGKQKGRGNDAGGAGQSHFVHKSANTHGNGC